MKKIKMTIHRGLSELKTLDDRISKAIEKIQPTGVVQVGKKVNNVYEKSYFDQQAKSDLQSFDDLLARRNNIKSAIVQSNSETKITIGTKTMTVADAITNKGVMSFKRTLVISLERKFKQSVGALNTNNEQVKTNSENLALAVAGNDQAKKDSKEATEVAKVYIDNNEFSLVDPLEVEKLIDKINTEISEFETEVDAVLSESNAVTFIEV